MMLYLMLDRQSQTFKFLLILQESEVQVPQVPLTGKSVTPPAEESGDAVTVLDSNNDDDNTVVTMTTTTATSEDEWAGLTQSHQPVDQSETVSVP